MPANTPKRLTFSHSRCLHYEMHVVNESGSGKMPMLFVKMLSPMTMLSLLHARPLGEAF